MTITTGALWLTSGYTMNACTVRFPYLIETHSRWRGDLSSFSFAHGVASIWICIACGLAGAAPAGCWARSPFPPADKSPAAKRVKTDTGIKRLRTDVFIGGFGSIHEIGKEMQLGERDTATPLSIRRL